MKQQPLLMQAYHYIHDMQAFNALMQVFSLTKKKLP